MPDTDNVTYSVNKSTESREPVQCNDIIKHPPYLVRAICVIM